MSLVFDRATRRSTQSSSGFCVRATRQGAGIAAQNPSCLLMTKKLGPREGGIPGPIS
jgi:hypothetical protein